MKNSKKWQRCDQKRKEKKNSKGRQINGSARNKYIILNILQTLHCRADEAREGNIEILHSRGNIQRLNE